MSTNPALSPSNVPLKLLFVLNPSSGRKRGTNWESEISKYFEELQHDITIIKLEKGVDIKTSIDSIKPDRVIAVGGDGTVNALAEIVGGTNLPMGILPAGSANGMAKELNIPNKPQAAIDIVVNAEPKSIDAILINDKDLCLHLSDLGLNARLIKYFDDGELRGMLGYAKGIIRTWQKNNRLGVAVQTKNEEVTRTAVMVALANARKYGTGTILNHIGELDDGFFEVIIVRKLGAREMFKALIRNKRQFHPKHVEVLQAKSVLIGTSHKVHFQIDGEYKGKVSSVAAKILPGHLQMLF